MRFSTPTLPLSLYFILFAWSFIFLVIFTAISRFLFHFNSECLQAAASHKIHVFYEMELRWVFILQRLLRGSVAWFFFYLTRSSGGKWRSKWVKKIEHPTKYLISTNPIHIELHRIYCFFRAQNVRSTCNRLYELKSMCGCNEFTSFFFYFASKHSFFSSLTYSITTDAAEIDQHSTNNSFERSANTVQQCARNDKRME